LTTRGSCPHKAHWHTPSFARDRAAVEHAISILSADFTAIDLLVNNAGLAKGLQPAHRADIADWEQMLDTNCKGLLYCTRAILPGMVSRGKGHVINLGSIAGTYPYPGGNVYGATKAFVHQFSLNLRSDLHGTGVRVTCIEPGMSGGTEFSTVRFDGDEGKASGVYAGMQPLTALDIAESVHWAASEPAHVNINTIELMPVDQSFAPVIGKVMKGACADATPQKAERGQRRLHPPMTAVS
jgi:3-hydroxy acid dehydrogenase / malonic semialdehyde reductase